MVRGWGSGYLFVMGKVVERVDSNPIGGTKPSLLFA